MAYTRQQWESFNARIPVEDRMSYDFYLTTLSVGERRSVQETVPSTLTIADERDKFLGAQADTQAQVGKLTPAQGQAALTKFTAGQSLTEAEKAYLGLQTEASKAAQLAAEEAAALAEKNAAAAALAEKLRLAKEAEEAAKAAALAAANAKTAEEKAAAEAAAAAAREAADAAAADANATGILAGENSSNTQAAIDAANKIIPPGTAWVKGPDGVWVMPPMPTDGKKYTFDNDKGWILDPNQGDGGPGEQPGLAWIKSPDGKSWIKPTMPTQQGFSFSWDDDKGWIGFKVGNGNDVYETVNGILQYNGIAFTGTYNGQEYIDGKLKTVSGADDYKTVDGVLTFKGAPFTGTYNGKEYVNGKLKTAGAGVKNPGYFTDPVTGLLYKDDVLVEGDYAGYKYQAGRVIGSASTSGGGANTGGGSATGGFTQKDIDAAYQKGLDATAQANAARMAQERESTVKVLQDRFSKYGLSSLASKIKELAVDGATEATITLQLQETPEYQMRFAANDARLKKNLRVLSPAEYLNAEDEYRQKLRDYGLKDFDNDTYVKQFIANDTSLTEISNRIVTAVQRVQNADPAILKQLDKFYGIKPEGLVAYMLDPEQQFEKIKLQVASAEIGVEAGKQGLSSDMAISEQLAKQGVTQAEAQKGYATIADILPTAEKLSAIYGGRLDAYNQSEGEQEVFNSLASAQRKRQKLSAAEIAQFSGSSGLSKTSLMDQTKGQF